MRATGVNFHRKGFTDQKCKVLSAPLCPYFNHTGLRSCWLYARHQRDVSLNPDFATYWQWDLGWKPRPPGASVPIASPICLLSSSYSSCWRAGARDTGWQDGGQSSPPLCWVLLGHPPSSPRREAVIPLEMFFGGPQSCSSSLSPAPHRNPIGRCSSEPSGGPRAGRGAGLSAVLPLLLQSRLQGELELLEKMKRCRRRRPDSCSLKGRLIGAVRFSSTAQTRYSSAASTPLCRWWWSSTGGR